MSEILYEAVIYVEILTAVIASIFFYKYKETTLKYFLFFLWYVTINEAVGKYNLEILKSEKIIIYNIYLFINFTFLFFIYWNFLKNIIYKNIVITFSIIYVIVSIVDIIYFENYLSELLLNPFMIGSSFLTIIVFLYFIEILNSEKILLITRDILFWISFGVLLFNIGMIPWIIMRKYFYDVFVDNYLLLNTIFRCLIFILNFCYIIGFIWGYKMQKQQLS
ncbi:hypothetical protein [Kordia sp.]|uniref:hypothetical protein n=1 Tax=Kordia sp. TaxID=1965332 RepID=UPI003D268BB2